MVKTRKVSKNAPVAKKRKNEESEQCLPSNGKQNKGDAEIPKENYPKKSKRGGRDSTSAVASGSQDDPNNKNEEQEIVEAQFKEDGKLVKMRVQKGKSNVARDQNADNEDGEITEPGENESSSDEGDSSSNSDEDSSDDNEVILSYQNNNASRVADEEPEEEELDYEDDVKSQSSQDAAVESSDEEGAVLRKKMKKLKRKKKGTSREEKETLAMIQNYCARNGLELQKSSKKKERHGSDGASGTPVRTHGKRGRGRKLSRFASLINSPSEVTIYKNAVKRISPAKSSNYRFKSTRLRSPRLRNVTKSDDELDNEYINKQLAESFIADCQIRDRKREDAMDQVRAGPSHKQGGGDREPADKRGHRFREREPEFDTDDDDYGDLGEERANRVIREAEAAKARLYELPGEKSVNEFRRRSHPLEVDFTRQFVHSTMVDEGYSVVAAHLDEGLCAKIVNHDYVDFAKLLTKDKVFEEERGIELIPMIKGGKTIFAPPLDRENSITSFNKWEQAFRVFSAIYTRAHPSRAYELVQYNFMIHNAASTFVWSNVYSYDRDFRIHMSKNPGRSWGLILQQAWTFRLKTKLSEQNYTQGRPGFDRNKGGKRDVCYRYNRGKCSYGNNCKFEHRCSVCGKRGHGSWNCRKVGVERPTSAPPVVQEDIRDKETGEKKRKTEPN